MRALVLVDIQNDFCPGGALAVPHGDEVVAVANRLAARFDLVVATQDWHPPDHGSFAVNHPGRQPYELGTLAGSPQVLWPAHCVQGSAGESWPGNFGCPRWNLRKFKLPMPGVKGASARGRLLYIVDRQAREIYLLWIYTHQEFIKQPPTTDLKKAVKDLVRHLDD